MSREPSIADEWANNWVQRAHQASQDKVAADAAAEQKESEGDDDDEG